MSSAFPQQISNSTISLRPVTEDDDEFLLSVYASTRANELAQTAWNDEQKRAFVSWQYELQRREYDARFPSARYDIILVSDRPAGRLWVGEDEGEIRLLDIALQEEFQGQGIGTFLLKKLIQHAIETHKPLRHMVFVLNVKAYRFYERLGFTTIEDLGAYRHMEWRSPVGK
jgi:GNAT superfamily N-acetyltransferase